MPNCASQCDVGIITTIFTAHEGVSKSVSTYACVGRNLLEMQDSPTIFNGSARLLPYRKRQANSSFIIFTKTQRESANMVASVASVFLKASGGLGRWQKA